MATMPEAEVKVRFVGDSEGTAELIERLIIATLKARELRRELVHIIPGLPGEVANGIVSLTTANAELFEVCDEKAKALENCGGEGAQRTADRYRWIIERDLTLCKSRASIRADLNARLGCDVSGESVKRYGA